MNQVTEISLGKPLTGGVIRVLLRLRKGWWGKIIYPLYQSEGFGKLLTQKRQGGISSRPVLSQALTPSSRLSPE